MGIVEFQGKLKPYRANFTLEELALDLITNKNITSEE
jgi:hypothetical protein